MMINIILGIFIITYLMYGIYNVYKFFQFNKCMWKLKKFMKLYKKGTHNMICNDTYHKKSLNSLMRFYPIIYRYFQNPKLSRSADDYTNFVHSQSLYKKFLDEKDFKRNNMFTSFSPLSTINLLLSFPYNFLYRVGFRPRKANTILINIIGNIIELVFLGLTQIYSEEIKMFIGLAFNYFIHR